RGKEKDRLRARTGMDAWRFPSAGLPMRRAHDEAHSTVGLASASTEQVDVPVPNMPRGMFEGPPALADRLSPGSVESGGRSPIRLLATEMRARGDPCGGRTFRRPAL